MANSSAAAKIDAAVDKGLKERIVVTETGEFESITEWVLETVGTDLMRVLSEQDVDGVRINSNDISEIFHVLGIEAARQSFEKKINADLQFNNRYVNYRHISLFSDVITANGDLEHITSRDINRMVNILRLLSYSIVLIYPPSLGY